MKDSDKVEISKKNIGLWVTNLLILLAFNAFFIVLYYSMSLEENYKILILCIVLNILFILCGIIVLKKGSPKSPKGVYNFIYAFGVGMPLFTPLSIIAIIAICTGQLYILIFFFVIVQYIIIRIYIEWIIQGKVTNGVKERAEHIKAVINIVRIVIIVIGVFYPNDEVWRYVDKAIVVTLASDHFFKDLYIYLSDIWHRIIR